MQLLFDKEVTYKMENNIYSIHNEQQFNAAKNESEPLFIYIVKSNGEFLGHKVVDCYAGTKDDDMQHVDVKIDVEDVDGSIYTILVDVKQREKYSTGNAWSISRDLFGQATNPEYSGKYKHHYLALMEYDMHGQKTDRFLICKTSECMNNEYAEFNSHDNGYYLLRYKALLENKKIVEVVQKRQNSSSESNYKFSRPITIRFPVKDGKTTIIPAGTQNVEIAYGASSKTYMKNGILQHQNIYRCNGILYNM